MALVINKTTYQIIDSANSPDYDANDWLINPDLSAVSGVSKNYWKVVNDIVVEMSTEEKSAVDAKASQVYIESVIKNAIAFGTKIMTEYAAENVLMGITQAGMTGIVRTRMASLIQALQTGSLYDAITEAKAIPPENKDGTFITDARLLTFVNKVETYLGIALSQTL